MPRKVQSACRRQGMANSSAEDRSCPVHNDGKGGRLPGSAGSATDDSWGAKSARRLVEAVQQRCHKARRRHAGEPIEDHARLSPRNNETGVAEFGKMLGER